MEIEIVEAVRQILNQLFALSPPPRGINRIVREIIFFLYEGGDAAKWSFERPHSAIARRLHREARSQGKRFDGKNFPIVYDHAIPLDTLRNGLPKATASHEKMCDFLVQYVQGVVIHKDEDASLSKAGLRRQLPPGEAPSDMLARYRKCKITFEPDDEAKLTHRIPSTPK